MSPSSSTYLREFVPPDLPDVRWLHDRTPPAGQVASRPQPWPDALTRIPEVFVGFWLAVEPGPDGDTLVGMAALEDGCDGPGAMVPCPPSIDTSRRLARLEYMRVAPERQRRGIGRLLTSAAISAAREAGYEAIVLDTRADQEAALALYRSMGFTEVGRAQHGQWDLVWFELDLQL